MKWCMVSKWRKHDLHLIAFQGPYVIQHKGYGINDEVYMEGHLQNLFFFKPLELKSIWIRKRGTMESSSQIKPHHWLEQTINEQNYKTRQHTCSPQFAPQLFLIIQNGSSFWNSGYAERRI